jgi:ADP-heptose:LPS heptosyltransferase
MSRNNTGENIIYRITRLLLAVPEKKIPPEFNPLNILVVRQHNQFGDMLAGVSLFRALKEKYPQSKLTLIAGPQNYYAVEKNKFIDDLFVFDKRQIINPGYLLKLMGALKNNYDLVIVPVTVSISFTSNLVARFSDARYRLGPASLDGIKNKSAFLFNHSVDIDWRKQPGSHVAERITDILKPLNITPSDYASEITIDNKDLNAADKFIFSMNRQKRDLLIGFHVGAGKPQNRWSLNKYIEVVREINSTYSAKFYFTGGPMDKEEIEYMKEHLKLDAGYFLNRKITELAALVSLSDLFITNDTGVMHVAGAVKTPQISLFGPTDPYNWAPLGENKYYIRKSDLIDEIDVEDVLGLCKMILNKSERNIKVV